MLKIRLQDQAEHEGVMQLGLCRVGIHRVFLVAVKLVTPLSRIRAPFLCNSRFFLRECNGFY